MCAYLGRLVAVQCNRDVAIIGRHEHASWLFGSDCGDIAGLRCLRRRRCGRSRPTLRVRCRCRLRVRVGRVVLEELLEFIHCDCD